MMYIRQFEQKQTTIKRKKKKKKKENTPPVYSVFLTYKYIKLKDTHSHTHRSF